MKKKLALAAFAGWTFAVINTSLFVLADEDLKKAYVDKFNRMLNL